MADSSGTAIQVDLAGGTDRVKVSLFSVGMTLIAEWEEGQLEGRQGWTPLVIPRGVLDRISNGLIYYRVIPFRNDSEGSASMGRLMLLQ